MGSAGKRVQGIIFDIDGTLVDSNDAHARAWQEAFRHFDKEIRYGEIRKNIGKGGDLLVPDLLDAREMRTLGESVKKFRKQLFREKYLPRVTAIGDVAADFRILRERGVRIVLATSSDPDEVRHHVELLRIGDLIDGSTSKKDAEFSKPSPEIFQSALEKIGTGEWTFIVGDTPYDILAAHRAATPIAAVLSGGFEREELKKAEFLFQDVHSLVKGIDTLDDYFNR